MTNSQRRIALLTGASLAAMGLATPAYAVDPHTTVTPPKSNPGYTGSDITIDLCQTTPPVSATAQCFHGQYPAPAAGLVSAVVAAPATGSFQQFKNAAGPVALTINNSIKDAEIGAIALANSLVAGNVTANADINDSAIAQTATALGGGNASVVLNNDFELWIHAVAMATGIDDALANASINADAIHQYASLTAGAFDASAQLVNDDTIAIIAYAEANAGAGATDVADASANAEGIDQQAINNGTGDAVVGIDNNGAISVIASAIAVGADADADASVSEAIVQSATVNGDGNASALFNNVGTLATLDIRAHAFASATGAGQDASADATLSTAIYQFASVTGAGNALAGIVNDGAINIGVTATAIGAGTADASVSFDSDVIAQSAIAADGNATASISNSGSINIDLIAKAVGGTGAEASASVFYSAIHQSATASGTTGGAAALPHVALAEIVNDAGANISLNVVASASAAANDATANVDMDSDAVGQSVDANLGAQGTASIVNDGTFELNYTAKAVAATGDASASASLDQYQIYQDVDGGGGGGLALIDNDGTLTINGAATATGDQGAFAYAKQTEYAVYQSVSATGAAVATPADAVASIVNGTAGVIDISMNANAHAHFTQGSANATFSSAAIYQEVTENGVGNASALIDNSGDILLSANAHADGSYATATAFGYLMVYQSANNNGTGNAVASLANNDGALLDISLAAQASSTRNSAYATASLSAGVYQSATAADGNASALITNAGAISITADAKATAETEGHAFATIGSGYAGIWQSANATGGDALASLVNTSSLDIIANATASGNSAEAQAYVTPAIYQTAQGLGGSASAVFDNNGDVTFQANAKAVAGVNFATATATITGISQYASATGAVAGPPVVGYNALVSVLNGADGAIAISANATATGITTAQASANAIGIFQHAVSTQGDVTAQLLNDGSLLVAANALADAAAGSASASAVGLSITGSSQDLNVDVLNSTDAAFTVSANATAPSTAQAYAIGISASVTGATPLAPPTNQALLTGSIVNDGVFTVRANASGSGASTASATGINLVSGVNTMTVTNTGTFTVEAITANGGGAAATGVRVTGNGLGLPPGVGDVFTFTNDGGDIIVRQSTDAGDTWTRGMAIDVSLAPNPSVINLLGDGSVYGNIDDATTDTINVESGTTYFDGIINPEYVPAGGFTTLDLDSSVAGDGSLVIANDGNLVLAGNPTDPAYAIVDHFTVATDGTITFELQPTTSGVQDVGTYPQVYANDAHLLGTLVADIQPAGGLFGDTYTWENVIDAHTRTGGFDGAQCQIGGAYSGSLFLDLDCVEDADDNIDLVLTRTAFNAISGLNVNGQSAADGLECIYDPTLTGGIADLLGDLFTFTDPVAYNVALNNLAGEGYANYLQSFPSLGVHYNDLIDHATNCEIPALAGSILECRASAPLHLWGQLDYQWRKADGDGEAGTAKAKRFSGLIGLDANVGNAAIVGASLGIVNNNTRTGRFDEKVDGQGFQVGLYGAYDPGQFYVKAVGTYSWFDGDSKRVIDFAPLGGTFAGTTRGDPDVNMWTFGLHGGYRIAMGGNSVVTPYLDYDYVNAKLKSFTETGADGANLTVLGGRSKHSFLTGGVKWATQMGGVVPEVNLGYRYRFGSARSSFDAAFIGDTACSFETISAAQKKGTFLAGLSVGGKVGPVDLRIGYEGEYNSDIMSHSGNFKIVIPLGGRAAPPPPPAPVMAPPPPPPAPVEAAPPPPPPPPAPVERGERGQ